MGLGSSKPPQRSALPSRRAKRGPECCVVSVRPFPGAGLCHARAPAGLRGDRPRGAGTGTGIVAAARTSPPPSPFPPVFFCMLSLSRSPLERCFTPKCLIIRAETVPFPEPGGPMMTARSSGGTTMVLPLLLRLPLLPPRAGRGAGGAPPSRGAPPRTGGEPRPVLRGKGSGSFSGCQSGAGRKDPLRKCTGGGRDK